MDVGDCSTKALAACVAVLGLFSLHLILEHLSGSVVYSREHFPRSLSSLWRVRSGGYPSQRFCQLPEEHGTRDQPPGNDHAGDMERHIKRQAVRVRSADKRLKVGVPSISRGGISIMLFICHERTLVRWARQ